MATFSIVTKDNNPSIGGILGVVYRIRELWFALGFSQLASTSSLCVSLCLFINRGQLIWVLKLERIMNVL